MTDAPKTAPKDRSDDNFIDAEPPLAPFDDEHYDVFVNLTAMSIVAAFAAAFRSAGGHSVVDTDAYDNDISRAAWRLARAAARSRR